MILTAKDLRITPGLPSEASELFDFLEEIGCTFATADGENWTCDWSVGGISHMDCKGGAFDEVWTRLMRALADCRVNGHPILTFARIQ